MSVYLDYLALGNESNIRIRLVTTNFFDICDSGYLLDLAQGFVMSIFNAIWVFFKYLRFTMC